MSVEWFFKLKEVDSLTKMRTSHLNALSEQENRLSVLKDRQNIENQKMSALVAHNHSLQQEIFEMEQKLKLTSIQKQRFIEIGADESKISSFSTDINALEEKGFTLLELVEQNDQEMQQIKTFLTGLEKTLADISTEAMNEIEKLQIEIKNTELRISLLMEELPSHFKTTLIKTTAKNLAHGPFTRVDGGHCYFCRSKISRIDESEIDMQQALKVCAQCDRIFLPYGA